MTEPRIRLGEHDILKKKTALADLCLLHLGTDPSMDLALSFAEWVRMTAWGGTT